MTVGFHRPGRHLRELGLGALVLICACDPDVQQESPQTPLRLELELAGRLHAAEVHREGESVDLCGAPEFLTSGWHEQTPADLEAGLRWTSGRNAVIDVPIVTPGEARLELDLEPLPDRSLLIARASQRFDIAPQRVRILWNGHELASEGVEPDGPPLVLDVPGSVQRAGPNRLELQPSYWLGPAAHRRDDDRRILGLACRRLSVSNAAASDGGASAEGRTLLQQADSVSTFGLDIPAAARLRGTVSVSTAGGPEGPSVSVSLAHREGTEILLESTSVPASGEAIEFDVFLGTSGLATLSLAVASPRHRAGPSAVAWRALRVEGASASASSSAAVAELPRRPFNVFVLLLDSLRADHTEPYGATGVQTPGFERLAAEGVTFAGARSNASWTRSAVASMLTSLLPPAHGVVGGNQRLAPKVQLLPELLREHGYTTVGITANPTTSRSFGFQRGFDRLHDHFRFTQRSTWTANHATPEARARFVWDRYLAPVLESEGDAPFFAYLHEIDPHSPFTPESPFDELYDVGYRGTFDFDLRTLVRIHDDPSWVHPLDMRHANSRYRGEISFMDRYISWMLDRLDAQGLGERTLFVVTSDHGEEFLDHGSVGHGHTVYEELLRVPLLMRLPGILPAGRKLNLDAQLIDLPPTILDLIGEPIPESMQGKSLLDALAEPVRRRRPSVSFSGGAGFEAVKLGDWKLIREHATDDRELERYELYDLGSDPKESRDLWEREPAVGHALRQLLRLEIARGGPAPDGDGAGVVPEALDPGVAEGLRALGYLD